MSKKLEGKTNQLKHKHGEILGVCVDSTTEDEVLRKIDDFLTSEAKTGSKFVIVTPNPEIVLRAQSDETLRGILNKADVSVPDGVGLKIFGNSRLNIIHGRMLMLDICGLASRKNYKVFLIGASVDANLKAKLKLKSLYPNLRIESKAGATYDNQGNPVTQIDIKSHFDTVQKINNFSPDIIFVALGCPKQERWIEKYLPLVKARLAMTVGGGLDYLGGSALLPPSWVEKMELEWLWRAFTQPLRIGRIFNATIVFPIEVLKSSFK